MVNLRDKRRHIADTRHQAGDHLPAERRTAKLAGLADDGPHAVRPDDAPDEEGDPSNWNDDCLDRKQVATVL